jgi:putative ABC transport system permease protein
MLRTVLEVGLELGCVYGPLALAAFISFRVLSLPDLTMQGAFGVGGGLTATCLLHGYSPVLALVIGAAAGAVAGLATALLHTLFRFNVLLASLMVTAGCWSFTIIAMGGQGNQSVISSPSVFGWAANAGVELTWASVIVAGGLCVALFIVFAYFFSTTYGLSLRASGMDIQSARGMGVRTEVRQMLGMMLSGALAATSGGLLVQLQGFADVTNQTGVLVNALAALIVGAALIHSSRPIYAMAGVLLGGIVYQAVVAWAINDGVNPNDVQLVSALIVVVIVGIRNQAWLILAPPKTGLRTRRRHEQLQYLEEDKVVHIL